VADCGEHRQARLDASGEERISRINSVNDLVVVTVYFVIQPAYRSCQAHVEIDEGVETLPDQRRRQVGHALQLGRQRDRRQLSEVGSHARRMSSARSPMRSNSALIFRAAVIAAQIDRDRLMQGEHLEALFFDVVFVLVDLPIASMTCWARAL